MRLSVRSYCRRTRGDARPFEEKAVEFDDSFALQKGVALPYQDTFLRLEGRKVTLDSMGEKEEAELAYGERKEFRFERGPLALFMTITLEE